MRILVTGAAGFIGSHVAASLLRAGHETTLLARRPSPSGPHRAARWVEGDLRQPDRLRRAFEGQDAVVHCAGVLPGVRTRPDGSEALARETEQAVLLAIGAGIARFVHISSLAVHEPPRGGECLDEATPLSARSAGWNFYARTKIAEEEIVRAAHQRGWIGAVILRPGVTFGPGDRHATPLFLRALASPCRFHVGRGDNPVASLVVEELAEAVALAVTRPGIEGRCYPLAGRRLLTQRDLFRIHARARGVAPPRWALPRAAALRGAAMTELAYRAISRRTPPVTRVGVWIVGCPSPVSCEAALADLDWRGERSVADAITRSIAHGGGKS